MPRHKLNGLEIILEGEEDDVPNLTQEEDWGDNVPELEQEDNRDPSEIQMLVGKEEGADQWENVEIFNE
jgi:hypothetical protein